MADPRKFSSTTVQTASTDHPTSEASKAKKTLSLNNPEEILNLYETDEKIRSKLRSPNLKLPPSLVL